MLPALFLRRAIDYTFTVTSGAGGFAISPQLTVLRMVDKWRASSYQVLGLVHVIGNKSEEVLGQFLEDVIKRLRKFFCAGEASPFDVDLDGRTLLHVSHI